MTRTHDVMHCWLAHQVGLPGSLALRQKAGEPIDEDLAALEEVAVLSLQALCAALGRWPWETPPPT